MVRSAKEMLLEILRNEDAPLTTEEIELKAEVIRKEYCLDSITHILAELEKSGKMKKAYSKEKKAYVWVVNDR